MRRPAVEVADILRAQGNRFLDRYKKSFSFQQLKAFRAIQNCRTAALGGHLDACPRCGHQAISYNSCRNRHCPKCQTQAREHWLAAREKELLGTSYFHVVFTVPTNSMCWHWTMLVASTTCCFAPVPPRRWRSRPTPGTSAPRSASSAHPLRDSCWRSRPRSRPLGASAVSLLSAGE